MAIFARVDKSSFYLSPFPVQSNSFKIQYGGLISLLIKYVQHTFGVFLGFNIESASCVVHNAR